MAIKSVPDDQGRLDQQRPHVTQFGAQLAVKKRIQVYTQGRYSPDPLRETTTESNGATITDSVSTATMDSGTNANGSCKLETKRRLNYAPDEVFDWSRLVHVPNGLKDDQKLRIGLFAGGDGVMFRLTADDLFLTIRDSFGGSQTDRNLRDIDNTAAKTGIDTSLDPTLLESPKAIFIRGSFYGVGKVIFGIRESVNLDPRDPGETETILGYYDGSKDPNIPDAQYTRTINLPSAIELDNDGTSPSSATTVEAGETQVGVLGDQPREPRPLFEQFQNLSVASADGEHLLCAIKAKSTFSGLDTDINLEVVEVDMVVRGGTDDVRFWAERILSTSSGDYDDSQYSDAPYEVGLGDNFSGGNVTVDRSNSKALRPAKYVPVGSQGSAESQSRESVERLVIGTNEVVGLYVEAPNADATIDSVQIDIDVGF